MKRALLLPGQGSQHVGMGRDLARRYPEAAELYERADECLGAPLSEVCWEGPEEELTRTENAQPAVLLHSYVVWRLLPESVRDSAAVAAGHSLGEFSAYTLAETFRFEDALRVVRTRGELMARSREGTMAAVLGLDAEEVEEVCAAETDGVVVAANYNAAGQVVISGERAAVERASRRAERAGARRVVPLEVSGAFHSPLMEVAREGLEEALERVEMRPPRFPVVTNVTAAPVADPTVARRLLVQQLTSPVRWRESVERVRSLEPDAWLELGPGSVLSGLARRIDRGISVESVGEASDVEELRGRSDG